MAVTASPEAVPAGPGRDLDEGVTGRMLGSCSGPVKIRCGPLRAANITISSMTPTASTVSVTALAPARLAVTVHRNRRRGIGGNDMVTVATATMAHARVERAGFDRGSRATGRVERLRAVDQLQTGDARVGLGEGELLGQVADVVGRRERRSPRVESTPIALPPWVMNPDPESPGMPGDTV